MPNISIISKTYATGDWDSAGPDTSGYLYLAPSVVYPSSFDSVYFTANIIPGSYFIGVQSYFISNNSPKNLGRLIQKVGWGLAGDITLSQPNVLTFKPYLMLLGADGNNDSGTSIEFRTAFLRLSIFAQLQD